MNTFSRSREVLPREVIRPKSRLYVVNQTSVSRSITMRSEADSGSRWRHFITIPGFLLLFLKLNVAWAAYTLLTAY